MKKVLLVLTLLFILSACGRARVEEAQARDTLFSVERSVSGTYGVFLTHDDSVVYCTANEKLGKKAISLLQEHSGEVVITFSSKELFKDTEGKTLGSDQCQKYCNGDFCFTTVILTDVRMAPSRN